eukprot:TRINITY_DN1166_c0_g1_i1.p1 TRINITY_DN1166_c0_g1~~TRINITY_DN1166_c0_g1_i1.p1  ORF type:complete len:229 (+),score=78.61 TRINITY_DN1166_c0_g1_i1:57-689(+)
MNGKGNKGAASGFKLDALSNLISVKSNDKKMSLLEYISMYVEKEYPEALGWVDEFEPVAQASRLSNDDLDNEKRELDGYIHELDELLQDLESKLSKDKDGKKSDDEAEKTDNEAEKSDMEDKANDEDDVKDENEDLFFKGMSKFQETAQKRMKELEKFWDDTFEKGVKTLKLYGEKPDKNFEDFSEYFKFFREDWMKAIETIANRKEKRS